jgi:hypothetical protein
VVVSLARRISAGFKSQELHERINMSEEKYIPPKDPIRLEGWSTGFVEADVNPYMAPELYPLRLSGKAYGHPRFEDGSIITTTPVVEFDHGSRTARTRSGSTYLLGDPEPKFVKWCEKNGAMEALHRVIGRIN